MKVLVACEFSGTVRDAFRLRGHDAYSCDIVNDASPFHIWSKIEDVLSDREAGWDLMIAHPPCTHLAVSGRRWFKNKQDQQTEALDFVRLLLAAPIPRIAIENPISIISTKIRKPDQIVEPYWFGDPFQKATCLWLKNLSRLYRTSTDTSGYQEVQFAAPSKGRAKARSVTYPGFAAAMANQWGAGLQIPYERSAKPEPKPVSNELLRELGFQA